MVKQTCSNVRISMAIRYSACLFEVEFYGTVIAVKVMLSQSINLPHFTGP